ncbi:MAG: hypothetical protein V2A54_10765 [Bacteroidota bacterium]
MTNETEAPVTYESGELAASVDSSRMLLYGCLSLAFSAFFGYSFFYQHEGVLSNFSSSSFLFFSGGLVAAVVFYFLSRNKSVLFIVNSRGIWDKSTGLESWDSLRFFSIVRKSGKYTNVNFLVLQYHNQQEKEINISRLNKKSDAIVEAIMPYAKEHKIDYLGETSDD